MPPLDHILAPAAQQAVIAGLFLAIGWWVVAVQNRRRDRAQRAERVRDVQGALYAEIRVYTDTLAAQDLPAYGAQVEAQILSQPGFFPVIPTEQSDRIYDAIVDEIHVLPFRVVDPVVRYYHQLSVIAAMVADLRALDVARIGPDRAARMYRHYIEMKIEAITLGTEAKQYLRAHLSGGDAAVARLQAQREKTRSAALRAGPDGASAADPVGRAAISEADNPASGRSGR